jgi:hypothetical protein
LFFSNGSTCTATKRLRDCLDRARVVFNKDVVERLREYTLFALTEDEIAAMEGAVGAAYDSHKRMVSGLVKRYSGGGGRGGIGGDDVEEGEDEPQRGGADSESKDGSRSADEGALVTNLFKNRRASLQKRQAAVKEAVRSAGERNAARLKVRLAGGASSPSSSSSSLPSTSAAATSAPTSADADGAGGDAGTAEGDDGAADDEVLNLFFRRRQASLERRKAAVDDAVTSAGERHTAKLKARLAARQKKRNTIAEDTPPEKRGAGVGADDVAVTLVDDGSDDAEMAESASTRESFVGDVIVGDVHLVCEFSEWLALRASDEHKSTFAKLASHAQRWSATHRDGAPLTHWSQAGLREVEEELEDADTELAIDEKAASITAAAEAKSKDDDDADTGAMGDVMESGVPM